MTHNINLSDVQNAKADLLEVDIVRESMDEEYKGRYFAKKRELVGGAVLCLRRIIGSDSDISYFFWGYDHVDDLLNACAAPERFRCEWVDPQPFVRRRKIKQETKT